MARGTPVTQETPVVVETPVLVEEVAVGVMERSKAILAAAALINVPIRAGGV